MTAATSVAPPRGGVPADGRLAAVRSRCSAVSGERGFTLIEVIVAVMLLSISALALSSLLGTVASNQAKQKVRQKQAASAEAIHERLRSEMGWTKMYGCDVPGNTCTINPTDFRVQHLIKEAMSGLNGVTMSSRITALAIDSAGDGQGLTGANPDSDGIIPDYWRLTVAVDAASPALTMKPLVMTSDVSTAASPDTGSLLVRFCIVSPQVDQRIAIAACPERRTELMLPPDPGGAPATSWDYATDAQKSMTIAPLRLNYRLTGPGGTVSATTLADGTWEHKGLVPGEYRITFVPPGGYEVWESHSIPAQGFATVEAGQRSQVLQVFKPMPRRVRMIFSTEDGSVPWAPVYYDSAQSNVRFKMISEPFGRTLMMDDWIDVAVGTQEMVLPPMEPGLYSSYVMFEDFTIKNRLSVPPEGSLPIFMEQSDGDLVAEYQMGSCDPDIRLEAWKSVGGSGDENDPTNLITVVVDGKEYRIGPTCGGGSQTITPPSGGGSGGT